MMQARATVLRVERGHVWLRLEDRPGGCGRCDEPGGCRSTRLTDVFKSSGELIRLPDSLGSRVGDGVTIGVPDGAPLRAALLCYVLPLGLMLGFAGLATVLAPFGALDADVLAGMAVGLFVGVMAARRITGSGRWRHLGLTLAPAGAAPVCGDQP
jgi:sigma-E factor negative regulatory protein RseC